MGKKKITAAMALLATSARADPVSMTITPPAATAKVTANCPF